MAEHREIKSVPNSATSVVITHNLGSVSAVLTSAVTGGWNGRPYISARDANTITITFGNQAPGSGTLTVDVEVKT